jgi:hypothetical protein
MMRIYVFKNSMMVGGCMFRDAGRAEKEWKKKLVIEE